MITGMRNGYEIYWDELEQEWKYVDTDKSIIDDPRPDITILRELGVTPRCISNIDVGLREAAQHTREITGVIEYILNDTNLTRGEAAYALFKFGYDHGFFTGCDRTAITMSEKATADSENKD